MTPDHPPYSYSISESVLPPPPPYLSAESGEWSLEGNDSPVHSVNESTSASFHRQNNQQIYSIHHDLEESLRHCGRQFDSMPVNSADMLDSMSDLLNGPGSNLMNQIQKRTSPILNHSSNPQVQVTSRTHSDHMTSITPLDYWSGTPERHEYIAHRLSDSASGIAEYQEEGQKGHKLSYSSTGHNLRVNPESNPSSLFPDRVSHFVKDKLLAELTNMDQEMASSSPCISDAKKTPPVESFTDHPAPYFEDVTSLEERVLHLGTSTFEKISRSNGHSILPLPEFELDTRPLDSHRPFSDPLSFNFHHRHQSLSSLVSIEELFHIRIRASLETLSAIRGGIKLLYDEGFCSHQGYNIIVVDFDRPSVLNVRSISLQSLHVLDSLLCEAGASEITQSDPILDDIAEILSHVTESLGLKISVMNDMQRQREKWQGICQSLSALLAVLHIALISFIRSHIDISGEVPDGALGDGLQIEAPGGKICLAARRLKCLHGLLKQPVWAFNFVPTDSRPLEVDYDGFYISITVDDFAELWGPLRLNYAENSVVATVASIETRGGTILAVDPIEHNVKASDDETLCHWFSWLDVSEYQKHQDKVTSTDTTKRLLIGMHSLYSHGQKHQKRRIRPKLEISEKCTCVDTYSLQYADFELSTKIPSWTLDAKSFQVSGGKYATLTVGFTYKFDAGWTLKDAILESWVDAAKDDPSHVPNPHHMDYLVVLDICRCSGHARRISLWTLLQSPDLRDFFRQNLEFGVFQEIEAAILQYSTNDRFATIWPDLDTNKRSVLNFAFKLVLRTLRCTGVGEDGLLQVWDITSMPRIDGRRIDPQWTRMVQDDIGCATFGIITRTRRKYKPPVRAHDPPPKPLPVLYTQVCITAKKKLNQTEDAQKQWEVPSSLNESNLRGFSSKWGVFKSNSINTRLGSSPDAVQTNVEEKLLQRIQAR
ncbi:hypothetical protein MFRU_043g00650 [Monilinia fructicola]|nr:hypothetical protein MFRU_043g00650 [Monilinia fructicola]